MNLSDEPKPNCENNSIAEHPKNFPWKKSFVIFLIILICVAYPILKMIWTKNKVENFCSHISIGMAVQGLEGKAKDYGLKVIVHNGIDSHPAEIIVWEGWAYARWFCEIEISNGKVVHKGVFFLD